MKGGLEASLGGRHAAFQPRIGFHRHPCRPRQRLETAFDDVVGVFALKVLDMQAGAGIHGHGVKPFLEQLGVHVAQFRAHEFHPPDSSASGERCPVHSRSPGTSGGGHRTGNWGLFFLPCACLLKDQERGGRQLLYS